MLIQNFLIPVTVAHSASMVKRDEPSVYGSFNFMEQELWKDIPNTNGEYQISNIGRIRSWIKKGGNRKLGRMIMDTPMVLKTPLKGGYPHTSINFIELKKVKTILIHQWVGKLFVPNPNNYPHVLHKDDNKANPHWLNLEWGTHDKNMKDAFIRGLITPAKGEARKKSTLTNKIVSSIFKSKVPVKDLAKKYNVGLTAIYDIKTGRSWNHVTGLLCTRKIKPKFSKDIKFKD